MSKLRNFGLAVLSIPDELKEKMQWGVSTMKIVDKNGRKDKAPRNPKTGELLDVTNPRGWGTFDEAVNSGYPAIGMRLTADDPYTVIDLDKSKNQDDNEFARRIYDAFDSYAEKSQSGDGIHIILRGPNEAGRRNSNVEIYSQERYIICTGIVVKDNPIIDGGKTLAALKRRLNAAENPDTLPIVQYHDEKESDHQILTKMFSAENGDKVKALYEIRPSASDDWSLLDSKLAQHICFYTRNPDQAIRLFRGSALYRGSGEKRGYDTKDKYENEYLLRRTFNRAWSLEIAREEERVRTVEEVDKMVKDNLAQKMSEIEKEALEAVPLSERKLPAISFPPGLVGDIAKYIYKSAPRPVPEVALSGALSMVSGIVGRHYNINSSGLGLYLVLLAGTGRGKEAASTGVSLLMDNITSNIPAATLFRGPSQIASGQGLIRVMAEDTDEGGIPSKLIILSEFGHTMNVICSRDANSADVRTRQVLLDMFSKNSWGSVIKESAYADKQNNTKEIRSPNLSLMGDTTPESFFKAVSLDILNEGFLPRFLVIEYDGPRTPSNYEANRIPPTDLVTRCQNMVAQVISMRDSNQCINITMTDEARKLLTDFDAYCDMKINTKNVVAEMWNRSHLQALRVAGVVAVGANIFEPVVSEEIAKWAIDLVKRSVFSVEKRLGTGAHGGGEAQREYELRRQIHKFFNMSSEERAKLYIADEYVEGGFLPLNYLTDVCSKLPIFVDSSRGVFATLSSTLLSLIQNGDLYEVSPFEILQQEKKAYIRADRLFAKGRNFDKNWKAQLSYLSEEVELLPAYKGE